MRAQFVKGSEPYKSLDIGKNRAVKKDDIIDIMYKGEKMKCIALDDEEYDESAERYFVDFMDSDGGICWATRENSGEDWWVPSANESVNFERNGDPKKSMSIGKDRHIKKGDRFFVKNYYDGKMHEVTAISDETTEWGAEGEPVQEVEISFDDFAGTTWAFREEDGSWMLSEG